MTSKLKCPDKRIKQVVKRLVKQKRIGYNCYVNKSKEDKMELIAYVKEKRTGERLYITRDNYKSKKDFIADLRGNGYAVSCCNTPAQHEAWLNMIDRAGAWGLKNITQAKQWHKRGWLN